MTNATHTSEVAAPPSATESRGSGQPVDVADEIMNYANLSLDKLFFGLDRTPGCRPFVDQVAGCLRFALMGREGHLISVSLNADEYYALQRSDQDGAQETISQPPGAKSAAIFFTKNNKPEGESQNIAQPALGFLVAAHVVGAILVTAETDNPGPEPCVIAPEMLVDFAQSVVKPEDAGARLQLVDPPLYPPDETMFEEDFPA